MLILTDGLAIGIGLAGIAGILLDVPLVAKRSHQRRVRPTPAPEPALTRTRAGHRASRNASRTLRP